MSSYSRRGRGPRRRSRRPRPRRPARRRLGGCLLLVLAIIIVLVILSMLFGGFQMGTKADGSGQQLSCPAAQCHG
jgi:ABC-type Fe3+ transport system permease subunit